MSPIVLFPGMDLACMPLASFGFSFLVVIEIGSLARFTCFSNVDLSCIFWSISNPFFQNTVFSLLMCFFEFIMEQSPIASIVFEVIQLSKRIKYQKCYFCIHFALSTTWWGGLVHFRSSSSSRHSFPFGNAILGIVGNLNCIK
jgi:hypothetical protein